MRFLLAILVLATVLLGFSSASPEAANSDAIRYRRWDPTHDFYDDYEFTRQVRRPFHPMAYRQRGRK